MAPSASRGFRAPASFLVLFLTLMLPAIAFTAEAPVTAAPPGVEAASARAYRVAVGGEDAAAFAGESLRELELRLAPMRLDELEQRSRSA
ncbi:MAG: hypothetical protein V2J24_16290, partial [Pseudomonadales bacterium]|nr:hypothetical protein [Pseudomonadales bacterium]